MAHFSNQATLSYNGTVTNSNIITGELKEALEANKYAALESYRVGDNVSYIVNLVNSGIVAFTGVSVSDDLGAYPFGENTLVPLSYAEGSLKFFIDGVLQPSPTVAAGPPLVISGINIPAGAVASIIYEAKANEYAPLSTGSEIKNTVTISGAGISPEIKREETVIAENSPELKIVKALNPSVLKENEVINYSFTVQNFGNTAVTEADKAVLRDTFDPRLADISVSFNGVPWALTTNYSYNPATGEFATVEGQITAPAAEYVQNPTTGAWSINPGVSTLAVSGTVVS